MNLIKEKTLFCYELLYTVNKYLTQFWNVEEEALWEAKFYFLKKEKAKWLSITLFLFLPKY